MKTVSVILQVIFLVLAAPLISGLIRKIKNNIRMRKGMPVLQPYYNLSKLFSKDEVISKHTSWIFRVTPYVVLSSSLAAAFLVPLFTSASVMNYMGDLILLVFIFALGRFFTALSGLEAGSSFGGMGSSREMFISSFAEPVAILSIFVIALNCQSTNAGIISGSSVFKFSNIIASISFFLVIITETSRIPVDNQETHLELTMVHEAMVLEYSGRSLAIIELGSLIKQAILFTLLANVFLPFGMSDTFGLQQIITGFGIYLVKITGICVVTAVIEVSVAKMRLFRVVDFLTFALFLSISAVIALSIGA